MTKRWLAAGIAATMAASATAQDAAPKQPPAPPPQPVTETLYGTAVTDPYRQFEKLDAPVLEWMRAQGRYTRAVLDSIPQRAQLLARVAAFTGGYTAVQDVQAAGGRTFYQARTPGSDQFDLMVAEPGKAPRKLVDTQALRAAHGGTPYAINYTLPSPDGSKVAVGTSAGGSEEATLSVLDVATGKAIAGPLALARFGATSWTDDGSKLFVSLLADLPPGAPETDKYKNSRSVVWDLKSDPVELMGGKVQSRVVVAPERFPFVVTRPGVPTALAFVRNGTQNEMDVWAVSAPDAVRRDAPWSQLAHTADDVTGADVHGDDIFLLSHHGAPTFQVLAVKSGQPLSSARVIVAAQPGRLIENIATASDGLYVQARRGVYSELFRIPYAGGAEEPIALPVKGSIEAINSDPREPGVVATLDSWVVPATVVRYDPAAKRFADLKLSTAPKGFDPAAYEVSDLSAKAKDGTAVPLSLVARKGASGVRPTLLYAYGSYGASEFPLFSARWAVGLDQGFTFATCHVRGGGELGEAWRLGGKDANKPNTWRDMIACGDDLVRRGITTPAKLFIMGGSAGGITMGRAMEERPDLFAAVVDAVPAANPLRMEFSPNGVPNIPEFGTVTNEAGFRNLLAMDSYMHVEDGKTYPPVMITTGLNDPRVIPWQPAKFAARLLAAGPKNPVLLRIDEQNGHGVGQTKQQSDEAFADILAFLKWRGGEPGWAPTVK